MHRRFRFLSTLAAVTILAMVLAAQTPTRLSLDVQLVNIVATVTDANGKFVPNLTADDFLIVEDEVPQKVAHFSQDHDVPVSVGIVLDTSGSMDKKIRAATEAVGRFINNVHADDDIFLMTFDRDVTVDQDFTSDRRRLARALDSIRLGGGTLLYDAVLSAIEKVRKGRHEKRAILLISDGLDAGSRRATVQSLVRAIRGDEILVYGLGTGETTYADPAEHIPFTLPTQQSTRRGPGPIVNPGQRQGARRGQQPNIVSGVNMSILTQFAENSGGRAFLLSETFVNNGTSEIDEILSLIAEELRSQYTLGYYPATPDNGQFHSIKVTAAAGQVRARTGYLSK